MTAAIWTVGEAVEYENGLRAVVIFVNSYDPRFAVIRKLLDGGARVYEPARRDRPVDAAEPSDDTWVNPAEDEGQFHTVDAAMAALGACILADMDLTAR
jgi:hypothetical protein